jgi:hypothetical protein
MVLALPGNAADPAAPLTSFTGTLDGKDNFGELRDPIASRSAASIANALRQRLANPGSEELGMRLAAALSIKTSGVSRKQWQTELVSAVSREFAKRLDQPDEKRVWPTAHFSVGATAELKLSTEGKLVGVPAIPNLTLESASVTKASSVIEDPAEAKPLRLSFKIREVSTSFEKVRWKEERSKQIAFEPRYRIRFDFAISETASGTSLEGAGDIEVSGQTQIMELLPARIVTPE